MSTEVLKLDTIETGGNTQIRAEINEAVVKEYADAGQAGAQLPPIIVYFDGARYWLADGFHRYWAADRRNCERIRADVRKGTQRDALLHAVGANAEHGLRRSNEDKRRAVRTLLDDEEWSEWSNGEVAKAAGVSSEFVRKLRSEREDAESQNRGSGAQNGDSTSNVGSSAKRTGADGKKRPSKKKTSKKAKASGSGNGQAPSGGNGSGSSGGSQAGSEGQQSAIDQMRTAASQKNGAEVGSAKERREAWKGLQKVVQLLDKLGKLAEYRQPLHSITEEIKPPEK